VKASMAAVPPLANWTRSAAMWPGRWCWRRGGADAIRDVFIFVEDSCELTIEPAASRSANGAGDGATARALEEPRASSGGPPHLRQARQRLQPARARRQARPVCRPGGRTGDGAGAAERAGRARDDPESPRSRKRSSG
jgi:hypothetical protein